MCKNGYLKLYSYSSSLFVNCRLNMVYNTIGILLCTYCRIWITYKLFYYNINIYLSLQIRYYE